MVKRKEELSPLFFSTTAPKPEDYADFERYTYNQVVKASTEVFDGDEMAAQVFAQKYALQDETGRYLELTPQAMHIRLATELARISANRKLQTECCGGGCDSHDERWETLFKTEFNRFYDHLAHHDEEGAYKGFGEIVLQGSPMSAIGNPFKLQSASNCFVVGSPHDSFGGIMHTDQQLAQLMKRRAGVGVDISTLRPKGLPTKNAAKTTDGIGVFMERFSNTCREVAQGGRRGAEMITVDCHHPEVLTFINIKRDRSKVTGANISVRYSKEFYDALMNDGEYELRFPVEAGLPEDQYLMRQMVSAKQVWDAAMQAAWESAEPGALFWDVVKEDSPSDIYAEEGFASISTNPCFSGDTLIAVADGRGAVSIKQLAEEGKDVPVYSTDPKTGMIEIKMGRNPRITGHNKKLLRVTTDKGFHVDVTPDHNMMLRDGTKIQAKDLERGMSLSPFVKELAQVSKGSKPYYRVQTNTRNSQKDKIYEHRLIAEFNNSEEWSKRYDLEKKSGWMSGGLVVHHKDYNGLNNAPSNLQIMSFKEHQQYHADHDNVGENNGKYSGKTNEEIKNAALELTRNLGRRFSYQEWQAFAKENNYPMTFSNWRAEGFYKNPADLAQACAAELGVEYANLDPRTVKVLHSMLEQGYDAEILNERVYVTKTCECCGTNFQIIHDKRESAFCSVQCALDTLNNDAEFQRNRKQKIAESAQKRMEKTKEAQAEVYSQLKFELGRDPKMSEWEIACSQKNLPKRIGKGVKYGYHSYAEVKEAGEAYNHKVVSIEELSGEHIVYNITVDDFHTLAVVKEVDSVINGVTLKCLKGLNFFQCGEIVLNANDSCRLTALNLKRFLKSPWTNVASFDFVGLRSVAMVAQEVMDLVVDLEVELVDRILAKIYSDPEPEHVKSVELGMWREIKRVAMTGRRTGLGLTALGDAMAACGIKYGSEESIAFSEAVARAIAVGSFVSSVRMAKAHGPFPIFNADKERGHVWTERMCAAAKEEGFESDVADFWKFGRRNISLTTVAPTGSVSIMTQSSSGVEPVFMPYYTRRRKLSDTEIEQGVSVDFVDHLGDKWHEYPVFHHGLREWMIAQGVESPQELPISEIKLWVERSPYWGATAMDQQWEKGVELQGAVQKWISHSISRTANIPNDAPVELVDAIYRAAWKARCKGYTVYRDGCRTGVLVSSDQSTIEKSELPQTDAPKRPEVLPMDVHRVRYGGEEWTVLVGLFEGQPFEVFAGPIEDLPVPTCATNVEVVKHARKTKGARYELRWENGEGSKNVRDIAKVLEAEHNTLTRLTSLSLRHGAKIQYVVEQLNRDESSFLSFSRVLARTLKGYIPEGAAASKAAFSDCDTPDLCEPVYSEGCLSCKGCGKSKCG
jgi:ribonucleotide reductase alpha subunit